MTQNDTLLLNVARNLRYRTLDRLIGETLTIADRLTIREETSAFVTRFAEGCTFAGPEQNFLDGQIAKYGLLDLRFNAPQAKLDATSPAGVPILRELGFVDGGMDKLAEELGGDSGGCIEELSEGIAENKAHLLLYLESSEPNVSELSMIDRMARVRDPATIDFPIAFTVIDACVSNSSFVWINKHFYL